jgi:hypothetical protein
MTTVKIIFKSKSSKDKFLNKLYTKGLTSGIRRVQGMKMTYELLNPTFAERFFGIEKVTQEFYVCH